MNTTQQLMNNGGEELSEPAKIFVNYIFHNQLIKLKIKEKPPEDFFKGIKTSLKSVMKHPDINLPKITNDIIKCNKIVIQTLMFMKLF